MAAQAGEEIDEMRPPPFVPVDLYCYQQYEKNYPCHFILP
jgi:hypothetical protein